MPMRLRLSRDERRRRLLAAAEEVFGEKGYRKTEVEEIVSRAGVTKPMLYRHFPGGKAEIYMEVLDEHLSRMLKKLWEAMGSTDVPLEALRRGIDAYFRFAEENPEAFHLLAETSPELDSGIVDRLREVRTSIARGLAGSIGAVLEEAGLSAEGAPIYANVLLGGVESVVSWWLDNKTLDRSAVVSQLLTFLWRGFDGLSRGGSRLRLELARLGDLKASVGVSRAGAGSGSRAGEPGR
jgi:AcrR family transcriptional regulator